jgi:YD repeat-containing protein
VFPLHSKSLYALGNVLSVATDNSKNGIDGDAADTRTTNTYSYRDGAVQSTIVHDGDTGTTSNAVYTTSFSYDGQGRLTSKYVAAFIGFLRSLFKGYRRGAIIHF